MTRSKAVQDAHICLYEVKVNAETMQERLHRHSRRSSAARIPDESVSIRDEYSSSLAVSYEKEVDTTYYEGSAATVRR